MGHGTDALGTVNSFDNEVVSLLALPVLTIRRTINCSHAGHTGQVLDGVRRAVQTSGNSLLQRQFRAGSGEAQGDAFLPRLPEFRI